MTPSTTSAVVRAAPWNDRSTEEGSNGALAIKFLRRDARRRQRRRGGASIVDTTDGNGYENQDRRRTPHRIPLDRVWRKAANHTSHQAHRAQRADDTSRRIFAEHNHTRVGICVIFCASVLVAHRQRGLQYTLSNSRGNPTEKQSIYRR